MQRTATELPNRGLRLALAAYALGLVALFVAGVHQSSPAGFPLGGPADYTSFYAAGHMLGVEDASRLYDLAGQSQAQQQLLQPYGLATQGGLLPYSYPPFFALIFAPLSRWPLPLSFLLWLGLSLGMVALAVLLLLRDLTPRWRRELPRALLVAVSFQPVLWGLAAGQSSAAMLLLLTVAFLAMKHRREGLAGAALALALLKPQLALPVVLVLVLLRRWRALAAFAAVALALLALSALLVGLPGLGDYAAMLRYSAAWAGQPGFYPEVMPNLRGSVYRLASLVEAWTGAALPTSWLVAATAAASLAGLVILVRLWRRANGQSSSDFGLAFAATLALTLLLSPHVYVHDLSLLVIAGFALAGSYGARGEPRTARNLVALGHLAPWLAFLTLPPAAYAQFLAFALVALVAVLQRSLRRGVTPEAESHPATRRALVQG